jgi:hypothetical protein
VAAATRRQSEPLRFIYISGHFTLRKGDEAIKQLKDHGLVEMALMRVRLVLLLHHTDFLSHL